MKIKPRLTVLFLGMALAAPAQAVEFPQAVSGEVESCFAFDQVTERCLETCEYPSPSAAFQEMEYQASQLSYDCQLASGVAYNYRYYIDSFMRQICFLTKATAVYMCYLPW